MKTVANEFRLFDELSEAHRPLLELFHNRVSRLLHLMAGDELYERRPPVGLRLQGESEILTLKPNFQGRPNKPRAIESGWIVLEMTTKVDANYSDGSTRPTAAQQLFCGSLTASFVRACRMRTSHYERLSKSLLAIAEDFTRDPMEVLRRSSDRCCICSRKLNDGASRARGIGPECWGRIGALIDVQAR